ncbi:MAG TPA: acyl-CoA thioesterase [Polyangiaceae bacterium LLY-WYZ-15_(1-7)]|nr:acyl-CoA thioesterase [Polyangiaceae bacterium LLY-WYZ-15_(1-7)]HJL05842.1 acyl-CoA thioesterase [Polyangiaceae bacterium LLY-WYZ-15_(1-7)]HJL13878.1 acyl-CoA thioesterase [Polyangiaceae bacterium LLY-WYZ-15_(1-7)]HJL26743.1 acyl-CoA thioesterase [Polyangiaceae bacterium LLY-WYZ-15_(1-7)]HJL29780.1 acyl-CoA thioesterase [Polyangiaceae bacterium LLY-WYZ-15_(1-7)]
MKKTGPTAVYEQRVPFHDCDPLRIVWHGHYYKYLEIARTLLFEERGMDMAFFREHGLHMVVIESRCRYAFPLRYGETLQVEAWFKDVEQRLLVAYEIRNLTHGRRAARAWTTLVAMRDEAMLMETPREMLERIRA